MTNLDSILKSRDITLPTKVHLDKAVVFPVLMYGWMWELDCEESWDWKIHALQLRCCRLNWNQSCPTLCDPMNCSTPGLPVHHQLPSPPKPMSIESVMPPNHLILCRPLLFLTSIFASIRVFSNELTLCIRWPKYCSFIFIFISPSNEYSGLISFRMDWLDLLAVQGTLKSLLQHHC